jgi:hypothetical protein
MPIFPSSVWYLSGIAMILVQTLNSASKPVIAESLYRLSTMMEQDPCKVFAKANMFRRIGNATIGSITPLLYAVNSGLSFYLTGAIMFIFLFILVLVAFKIQLSFLRENNNDGNDIEMADETTKRSTASRLSTISVLKTIAGRDLAAAAACIAN